MKLYLTKIKAKQRKMYHCFETANAHPLYTLLFNSFEEFEENERHVARILLQIQDWKESSRKF